MRVILAIILYAILGGLLLAIGGMILFLLYILLSIPAAFF